MACCSLRSPDGISGRTENYDEARFSGVPCLFFVNDECSVYESRPFACRKHLSFDVDSYWCQPVRSLVADMGMVRHGEAEAAYQGIVAATKLGGFADIRDFFPSGSGKPGRSAAP